MPNNLDKKHIVLIVEDNEINCEILNEILKDQYTLLFAANGQEGMDLLHQRYADIDVVLLDIQMPVMNGYEVLEQKGKETLLKDIPVIVTTSSNGRDEESKCLELGAHDFVKKPYEPLVVRLRIASIINLRESAEANRQKTIFIQNISHELRTPMNHIMGFAQIMQSQPDALSADDLNTFCGYISNGARSLVNSINNMVALSDFDINYNMALSLSDVSPNDVCRKALDRASYCIPEGVKEYFTTDVPDDFLMKSNANYLRQAIYNCLINANKFTQQGEVHVHCSLADNTLSITITDTGMGIAKEQEEYIFERFTKLNAYVPGLGIGLSVARDIATRLGGTVYLDTSHTPGSKFVITLPVTA